MGSVEYLHGSNQAELDALQSNLVLDTNVFRACTQKNVKKIVYASSVSVYPIDQQQSEGAVFSEDGVSYINPEGGYGWAKLWGNSELSWLNTADVGIARIFNAYGECGELGETSQVIPALICKALDYPQKDFVVWGSGEQTRCFLYISDCIDALLKLEKNASNPPLVVNIGSEQEVPIHVLAEKIVELSGKSIPIKFDPTKPVGPKSRSPSIGLAKSLLNWAPKTGLPEGLKRTYNWVQTKVEQQ